MKNVLSFSLLFITAIVYGQTFDFYNKKLVGDTCKIMNRNFTFVLKNFNTFKYNVLFDNKPVNNNLNMPDAFNLKLNVKSDVSNGLSSSQQKETFDDLSKSYNILKTSEQFYDALIELVSSDLSPERIIIYKKGYYQQYMNEAIQDDNLAVAKIMKYYSDLINNIKMNLIIRSTKDKKEKETIDTILKYTNKIELSKIPQKLASLYGAINNETFTVSTFIPKPNADDLIISIIAKPNSNYNNKSDEIKIEIPFSVKGGLKIDFSTGIFLSNIADKKYVNKPNYVNDSITGYSLVKEDKNPISYGIAAYLHAYRRVACNFNFGFTLGLGIDQNTQAKIMPGINIMLGRKERFIINGGIVVGKNKELSKVQDENHLYKVSTEPIYSEPYKIGGFVGISYNLTK